VTQPLALPPCEPGGPDLAALTASVDAWVGSPELAELVGHFDGELPAGPLDATLDWLADFSAVWDFRAGVRERFDTTDLEFAQDARLRALIRTLNLAGGQRPAHGYYDHVVVLGGGIRVAMGRTGYAARLLDDGLRAGTLAGLGSLRPRDEREHREGLRLGLEPFETEADMMLVALRAFLGLGQPASARAGDGWWHRRWDAPRPEVRDVHVLAAASTRPPRRANTADTLLGWAAHVRTPRPGERVLLVTNHPYVRHQHADAVRLLAGGYGCGIETVGYDESATATWGRPLRTTELLQEVRSSILATRNLYASLVGVPAGCVGRGRWRAGSVGRGVPGSLVGDHCVVPGSSSCRP
jgi:hypothetical protein